MNNEDQQVGQLTEHNGDPSIFIVIIIAGVCSKEDCDMAHPGIRKPNVHNQRLHRYCIFYHVVYTHDEYFKYPINDNHVVYTHHIEIFNILNISITPRHPTAPHPYECYIRTASGVYLTEFTWIRPQILLSLQTFILSLFLRIIAIVTIWALQRQSSLCIRSTQW